MKGNRLTAIKLKVATYHLLAAFLLPAFAAGQIAESRVTFDISAAEALIETFEAMQQGKSEKQVDSLIDGMLALHAYAVSAERFGAKNQISPVTLGEYKRFLKSFTSDSVNDQGNARLAMLKSWYVDAYSNLPDYKKLVNQLKAQLNEYSSGAVQLATEWLPKNVGLNAEVLVMFDIGGAAWAYKASDGKDYIMYSVLFLMDDSRNFDSDMFFKNLAHELHHVGIPLNSFANEVGYDSLPPNDRLKLYIDFMYDIVKEGMAQKFCSNAPGKFTPKPYPNEIYAAIPKGVENWNYFISDFQAINDSVKSFLNFIAYSDSVDAGQFYNRFVRYWTWKAGEVEKKEFALDRRYYYGAEVLGLVYTTLGKEALFEIMYDYRKLPSYFNLALKKAKPEGYESFLFDDRLADSVLHLK
jgi:hypothetical protein